MQVIIIAVGGKLLDRLLGISILERLLRILQQAGAGRVLILTDRPESVAEAVNRSSRVHLPVTVKPRPSGPLTAEQVLQAWPPLDRPDPTALILPIGVYDEPLIHALMASCCPAALIDSRVPARWLPLVRSHPRTDHDRIVTGAVAVDRQTLEQWSGHWMTAVRTAIESMSIDLVDVASLPDYRPAMRRHIRPYWFGPPSPPQQELARAVLLDAAQKHVLDLPAAVLHAPVETAIVRWLVNTRVTPNQVTAFTNVLAYGATALFALGHLVPGLVLALVTGVLDGVDGKLARVKVETTPAGRLEHASDFVFEMSWWIAVAWYLVRTGQHANALGLALLFVAAELAIKALRLIAYRTTGRSLDDLSPLDRALRAITGRRNVYVWVFGTAMVLTTPARAFTMVICWALASLAIHLIRVARIVWSVRWSSAGTARFRPE